MKATFLGGGSLRLLPILRGVFMQEPDVFRNGEIRLVDRKIERAQAVGALLAACPEYRNVGCKICWTDNLDEALDGIDVLYLTMGARREPTEALSTYAAQEYGYFSSDQLSVNGAFLSLRLGGFILEVARKMEKHCPDALMLIFPNPVSVYSCMVNTYTKIQALGICGGYNNHRFDLSRLCGRNEFDPDWNVVAAGVNHLSFILRGDYRGEDLYESLLPRVLNSSWHGSDCVLTGNPHEAFSQSNLKKTLDNLYILYRKYRTLVFSTEADGMAHIFTEDALEYQRKYLQIHYADFDLEKAGMEERRQEEERFAQFIRMSRTPEKVAWDLPWRENLLYGADHTDITIPILRAVAGIEKMRIVASRPNGGVIAGLPDRAAVEYTMDIYKKTVTPLGNQYIPSPFHGLIASLSEFQTLLAEAIAKHDPQIFAAALDAYPVHRFQPERIAFFRRMFEIYTDIDPVMRRAGDLLLCGS